MMRLLIRMISILISLSIGALVACDCGRDSSPLRTQLSALESAGASQCKSNQRVIEGAVAIYTATHDGNAPTDLHDLVPDFLDHVPTCPTDGADYEYDNVQGRVSCSLIEHRRSY